MFTRMVVNPEDPDVQAHYSRMTSIDIDLKNDIKTLILGLKTDDIWDKIDILCVVHDNEADSLLNVAARINEQPDSVTVNSTTFTADRGFNCTTTGTKYISLGIDEDALTNYSQYDGHLFGYSRTEDVPATLFCGVIGLFTTFGPTFLFATHASSVESMQMKIQGVQMAVVQPAPVGFIGASILAIDDRLSRLNDTLRSSSTSFAYALLSDNIVVGYTGGIDADDTQMAAWGIGGGLTSSELGLYEDRIRTYMQARGADVY